MCIRDRQRRDNRADQSEKLCIDLEYQSILHEELNRRIEETEAKGAIGIILNPQNGAILAIQQCYVNQFFTGFFNKNVNNHIFTFF